MKDAIGSSILFYIILGFIALFVIFIAMIMNYASAYRTNNYVVNMVEQTEGKVKYGSDGDTSDSGTLLGYLRSNRYYKKLNVSCSMNNNGAVFHVSTYIDFEIPMLGVKLEIPINNDTKTLFDVQCGNSVSCTGNMC